MFDPAGMEPAAFPVDVGLVMQGDGALEAGQTGPLSDWLRQAKVGIQTPSGPPLGALRLQSPTSLSGFALCLA